MVADSEQIRLLSRIYQAEAHSDRGTSDRDQSKVRDFRNKVAAAQSATSQHRMFNAALV